MQKLLAFLFCIFTLSACAADSTVGLGIGDQFTRASYTYNYNGLKLGAQADIYKETNYRGYNYTFTAGRNLIESKDSSIGLKVGPTYMVSRGGLADDWGGYIGGDAELGLGQGLKLYVDGGYQTFTNKGKGYDGWTATGGLKYNF